MSFREKRAWISFVLLVLLAIGYLVPVIHHDELERNGVDPFHYMFALFLAFAVLQVALHVLMAMLSPKDARTPKDERERLIELEAARIGFYALVVGVLLSFGGLHLHGSLRTMANTVMLAVMLAWLLKLGSELTAYRKGR